MNIFQILTPLTYWVLVGLWLFILGFLLRRLWSTRFQKSLLNMLMIILAIDALRTVFESIYFGIRFSSKSGFLPAGIYDVLVRPEIIVVPKMLNVVAAIVMIAILLYRWFPAEKRDRELQERTIKERTRELKEREEWLRLSTETANVAVWEYDLIKNRMARSQNHEALYGLEPHEIWTKDDFMKAVHPEDREFASGTIDRSIATGGPDDFHFDYRTLWPDHSEHWLSLSGRITARNKEGVATRMRGCLMDITERKQAEEELKKSGERFRSFMEHTDEGLFLYEMPGGIPTDLPVEEQIRLLYAGAFVECNNAQARMYGFIQSNELIGKTLMDIHGSMDIPENIEMFTAWIENNYRISGAVSREVDCDGKTVWFSNNINGVVENNRLIRVWGTQIDITQQKLAEEALRESEQKARFMAKLLMDSDQPVAVGFADGRLGQLNPAFCALTGYTEEELRTIDWGTALTPPEWLPMEQEALVQLERTDEPVRYEKEYIRKDGTRVPVELFVHLARDANGDPDYYYAFITDITELKRARVDVLKEKNRLQFALEVSRMGAWDLRVADLSSHRTRMHDHIFGYEVPVPDWTYEIFLEHVLPEDREAVDHNFKNAITRGDDWNFECRIQRADGEIRWIWAVGRPGNSADGKEQLIVGVVQDITERKKTELELKESYNLLEARVEERTAELKLRRDEAEALNRGMINLLKDLKETNQGLESTKRALRTTNKELEAFSYSVSHDLRAPLRHIDGFIELLLKREKDRLDATSSRYLNTIAQSSNRMGRLIDDLLAFSRTNRSEMHMSTVDMNAVIRAVVHDLSTVTEDRRIEWKIETLPSVNGDKSLLRQVWENLIGNAVKYTGNCEEACIEIGTTNEGDKRVFFIRDNGAGFDPQYTGKLFGVFQRLHRDDEFEGTGIGLATARRIVLRHRGKIWAEGKVDRGAAFYFTLHGAE
ncbi:PAS domain S-box protein [Pontiellaceae bacterium B1224]|nr:PAS domain S-box protein [Pontiellaceae bacterium B1224]